LARLTEGVRAALVGHGVVPVDDEPPEALRIRLNERYLEEVRALKARQKGGEIPIADYARHVDLLRRRFPLLALPLDRWTDGG
jgi:hypothetical protein